MKARYCFGLLLIWICHEAFQNGGQIMNKFHRTDGSTSSGSYGPLQQYNAGRADVGQAFFQHLIHDKDSFKSVNNDNICSLMHFFFRSATQNGQSVRFSSGMFVLYDSTGNFFTQLMLAKNAQHHSDEHRSGYIRRLQYFLRDGIIYLFKLFWYTKSTDQSPFIYLRGDESSHFHERGTKYERWHVYPSYGMDIPHGCMPRHFGHILFGKLNSLSDNVTNDHQMDRIYIKPEEYGLQQFLHYFSHTQHYIKSMLRNYFCRFTDRFNTKFCTIDGTFHEWIDRKWTNQWNRILQSIDSLTSSERYKMQKQASSQGIHEIYRQTLLFPLMAKVNDFRGTLEQVYGNDVKLRKGHEIIFTTEQLLNTAVYANQLLANRSKKSNI